ncbi:MAG: PaaI family thioesterase [Acidobacteriota bacterium]
MYNKDLTPWDVRANFDRQTFMRALGATLEVVEAGRVEIGVSFSEGLCQQNGFLHAGVLTSVADSACGYAALTMAPPDHDVLAVEFKINLLRPASAPRFVARARVLRAGRTLTVCTAEVFGITPSGEELVATMLSTVIVRPIRGA